MTYHLTVNRLYQLHVGLKKLIFIEQENLAASAHAEAITGVNLLLRTA